MVKWKALDSELVTYYWTSGASKIELILQAQNLKVSY